MIKVLVVEDSLVARELLVKILSGDPQIQVIGVAGDGVEAVRLAREIQPDLITMDICMPRMDGVEATKLIMSQAPTRIVIVSASAEDNESKPAFEAIKAGALTIVDKPAGLTNRDYQQIKDILIRTVKMMADVEVVTRWSPKARPPKGAIGKISADVVAIGASTGGPAAISHILKGLPPYFSAPILVVQHMTPGFTKAFVSWLNSESPISVKVAEAGEQLKKGTVFIAPDDCHFGIDKLENVVLTTKIISDNRHRPSIDYMFEAVANNYGSKAIAVLLTGMGEDGAIGLKKIKDAGGRTVAQDERSSVVFGMPKSAIEMGAVDQVLSLDKIALAILDMI